MGLCLLPPHFTEKVHDAGEDDQEDTTSRSETEDLGQETLVKRAESFLASDGAESGPGPVVLGHDAGDLGGVLNARLDDVHGGVEHRSGRSTNGTGDQVVHNLLALVTRLRGGHLGAHLENAAKVTGVPQDVAPQCRLETIVQRQGSLLLDNLAHNIQHSVVLVRLRLVLQPDLDQFERHHDKCFRGSCGSASEDGQGLGGLFNTEQVTVERAPGVIGGELGSTLGSLHQDGGGDTTVKTRGTERKYTIGVNSLVRENGEDLPFIANDFGKAIEHALVCLFTGASTGLELTENRVSMNAHF